MDGKRYTKQVLIRRKQIWLYWYQKKMELKEKKITGT
jgi:hypothetical protein